jgi:hypothetical protein
MKLYPVLLIFLFACQSEVKEEKQKNINPQDSTTSDKPAVNALPDSLLTGELIDGPANVRDTVNGNLIFSLYNGVPVTTTDTVNKWIQVGIVADVTRTQLDALALEKGDTIFFEGKPVGIALQKTSLSTGMETNKGLKGELVGYTSIENIRPSTIPEFALSEIINQNQVLTIDKFAPFFKKGGFSQSNSNHFAGFQLDESWLDDPSPLLRLWVLFNENKLFGVVHSRKLTINNSESVLLKRGFSLAVIGDQNQKTVDEFVNEFNSYITQVD